MRNLIRFLFVSILFANSAFSVESSTTAKVEEQNSWEEVFYSGMAWYFVPLATELTINVLEKKILPGMPKEKAKIAVKHYVSDFIKEALLKSHKKSLQLATNQHLTDYYSARIESLIFKSLSDEHEQYKTGKIQEDLLQRSLRTNAYLSKQAVKARKTYMRILTISDNALAAARSALASNKEDDAAKQIAFLAMVLLHVHPEMKASDIAPTVRTLFSDRLDSSLYPNFRQSVMTSLHEIDPLKSEFALFNFNYCIHLNDWQVGKRVDCEATFGDAALKEAANLLKDPQGTTNSMLASLAASLSKDQIRSFVFYAGLLAPSTAVYFVSKGAAGMALGKVSEVVSQHFAKIFGLATTKAEIERHASDTRKAIETWGFPEPKNNKKESNVQNSQNEMGDFANSFLGRLQKEAGKLLAEQPNFARSNIQRTLEVLTMHFADAYRLRQEGSMDEAAMIIAGAAVHTLREIVESSPDELILRAAILAFRPISDGDMLAKTRQLVAQLDPTVLTSTDIRGMYEQLLTSWASPKVHPSTPTPFKFATMQDELIEMGHQVDVAMGFSLLNASYVSKNLVCPMPLATSSTMGGFYDYVPSKDSIIVATKHVAPFAYSAVSSVAEIMFLNRYLNVAGATKFQKYLLHLTVAVLDFGLRSVGEPAVLHLQTVLKSTIDSATGLLRKEDAKIQDNLASKVDELQRKLSIEAQTSRSYRMEFEPTLMSLFSYAGETGLVTNDLRASALAVATAAYWMRALHPDFGAGDLVMQAIAKSRLYALQRSVEVQNLSSDYCSNIFAALATMDAHSKEDVILARYVEILKNWGFGSCSAENAKSGQELVSLFAQYGDTGAGVAGFLIQAAAKTTCDSFNIFARTFCGFVANTVEFSFTDPFRKKIQAGISQWMLNVVPFEHGAEKELADEANNQLTAYYRKQKFYFGKPELDVRTGIMMLMSSVISLVVDANTALANGNDSLAEEYYALALSRVITLYPEVSGDDSYLTSIFELLCKQRKVSESLKAGVEAKTIVLLKQMAPKHLLSSLEEEKLQKLLKALYL